MELLKKFLEKVLELMLAEYQEPQIQQLVISLKNLEMKLMDGLMDCAAALGIPRGMRPYRQPYGVLCLLCVKSAPGYLGRSGGNVLSVG